MRFSLICVVLGFAAFMYLNHPSEMPVKRWEMDLANLQLDDILERINALQESEMERRKEILSCSKDVIDLSKRLCENYMEFLSAKRKFETSLNAKESGFQTIHECDCVFFVSIKSASKYLDGYKVIFEIGNASSVTFKHPNIKVEWNVRFDAYDPTLDYDDLLKHLDEWKKLKKEKTFTISGNLNPGEWSSVELFLSPCSEQELENIKFSIDAKTVELKKASKTLISL